MRFIEISPGLSINFDRVYLMKESSEDPQKTDIYVRDAVFTALIPHSTLLKIGQDASTGYLKQIAENQRYPVP